MKSDLTLKSLEAKWVVPSANPNKIMVVLHGLGDSYRGYEWVPQMMPLPGFCYLLLNAPDPYFEGYSWFSFPDTQEKDVVRSRNLLFDTVRELEAQGFSAANQVWFGFSQGCLMVLDLALRYPKKFSAICGISGYLAFLEQYPAQFSPVAKTQKIWCSHGDFDPLLPRESTLSQYRSLMDMGISIEYQSYPKDHTILPEEIGHLHTWLQSLHT